MKVSKAIEMLSKYNPDDEIIIEWWSRDFTEMDDKEIPVDIWNFVADGYEFNEYTYSEMFNEIEQAIDEAMKEEKAQ
jgi:hypothetical protein